MSQMSELELRARALCQLAGLMPDDRFPGTGPNWTRYIDDAKAVLISEKNVKAGNFVNTWPQPVKYQNSPLTVIGEHEVATVNQMHECMRYGNVVAGAICADGHLGYAQPVGGVIAYDGQISISGVGFDIGCGNMAVRLTTKLEDIQDNLSHILREIQRHISFGIGRSNSEKVEHKLFDQRSLWQEAGLNNYKDKARDQLGTVGSGNHYVDLLVDSDGYVWIGVHFGSRGLGHSAATKYLKMAGGKDGINVAPAIVDEDSDVGQQYIAAMVLAGQYAYAGREWVVDRVRQIVGGHVTSSVHNHHNFAWKEWVGSKECWVVRKGATPLFRGQQGFVGGSMGDDAVILEGMGGVSSAQALNSTVHGAGRTFGRQEAKRRFTPEEMHNWLKMRGVLLGGAGVDESPMAYRRLPEVLKYHADSARIVHTLKPFLVVMAGESEYDPFKD